MTKHIYKHNYTYIISNIKENKHYIGARSTDSLPEKDLGVKYFSSSYNKDFISDQKENPQNYKYQIVFDFESREEALRHEIDLHEYYDVGKSRFFYNIVKQTSEGFDITGTTYIMSEKHKENLSKAKKENRYNNQEYEWWHENHGYFKGTRQQLINNFSTLKLCLSGLWYVATKRHSSHKGWIVVFPNMALNDAISNFKNKKEEINKKISKSHKNNKEDKTVYSWYHKDYGYMEMTKQQLTEKFSKLKLRNNGLLKIIKNCYSDYRGWLQIPNNLTLVDILRKIQDIENKRKKDMYPKSKKTRIKNKKNSRICRWYHSEYGYFDGSAADIKRAFLDLNLHDNLLRAVANGIYKQYKGWIFIKNI